MEYMILAADIFGTVIFAMTGAVKAITKRLDLFGVMILACSVGIGGGMLRDAVLGTTPAAALTSSLYLQVCIVTGLVVFILPRNYLHWHKEIIVYLDALGLGVFTFLGNTKAAGCNMPMFTIVLSGIITAAGGGVIRDVLSAEIPNILKSDFYATASLLGGCLYLVLTRFLHVPYFYVFLLVTLFVFALRIWGYHRKFRLPK